MSIDDLVDIFVLSGVWVERDRFISYLGRMLPPMPEADHNEANKVRGCMSQVWLTHEVVQGPPLKLAFQGDSDSHLVKGLIALLFQLCSNQTPQEILALDIESAFTRLGLENHITMNRRNGFYAMVERIRAMAKNHAAA